jgi:quercetin dioxygenase-like cupin family protein
MRKAMMVGVSLVIAFVSGTYVAAAIEAPKDNKEFSTVESQSVDLGPEIDGMAGRQLRMRLLKIEPGGHIGIHSHKDRPAVVYFLQGTDTVIAEDGSSKTFHPGDMSGANKETRALAPK